MVSACVPDATSVDMRVLASQSTYDVAPSYVHSDMRANRRLARTGRRLLRCGYARAGLRKATGVMSAGAPGLLRTCPLCEKPTLEVRGKRSDFASLAGYAPFVRDLKPFDRHILGCRTCGLSLIDPMYGSAELAELYGTEAYARFQQSVAPASDYRSPEGRRLLENWTNQYRALKVDTFAAATVASKGRATFLDVGCGGGRNMLVFQTLGFQTTGIEVNATEASQARALTGARVVDASAEHFAETGEQFDCVLASHVVEHVTDPVVFIRALDRLVAGNGLLVLETPLAQDSGRFEGRFRDIYHTHFFDHFTLTLLAQRTGYAIRSWQSIVFDAGIGSSRNWLLQAVLTREPTPDQWSTGAVVQMRSAYDALLRDALSWCTAFLRRDSNALGSDLSALATRMLNADSWRRLMHRVLHRR